MAVGGARTGPLALTDLVTSARAPYGPPGHDRPAPLV